MNAFMLLRVSKQTSEFLEPNPSSERRGVSINASVHPAVNFNLEHFLGFLAIDSQDLAWKEGVDSGTSALRVSGL